MRKQVSKQHVYIFVYYGIPYYKEFAKPVVSSVCACECVDVSVKNNNHERIQEPVCESVRTDGVTCGYNPANRPICGYVGV